MGPRIHPRTPGLVTTVDTAELEKLFLSLA